MRFITTLAFGLASLGLTEAGQRVTPTMQDCDLKFTEHWSTGQSDSPEWCASRVKKGDIIKGIRLWNSDSCEKGKAFINGMRIVYSNGDWTDVGKIDVGKSHYVEWDVAQDRVSVDLLPNNLAWKEKLYGMKLIASPPKPKAPEALFGGGEHDGGIFGSKCNPNQPNFDKHGRTSINGKIIGMSGRAGASGIEAITFYYIGPETKVHSSVIVDTKFTPSLEEINARPSDLDRGMATKEIYNQIYFNDRDADETVHFRITFEYKFSTSYKETTKSTWGWDIGLDLAFERKSIWSVNNTVSGSPHFYWKHEWGTEKENLEGNEKNSKVEAWVDIPVKPRSAVQVLGYVMDGKLDIKWEGTDKVTFTSHNEPLYMPVGGRLERVQVSNGFMNSTSVDWKRGKELVKGGIGIIDKNGVPLRSSEKAKIMQMDVFKA